MNNKEPVAEPMLNTADAVATPWEKVVGRVAEGGTTWLSTVRPDGRAHVVPIGALWVDGTYYFTTGQNTQKEKNLAHNPHCVMTLAARDFDLVFEGEAVRVQDADTLRRLAEAYSAQGWPATAGDGALDAPYSAPTTGPAPYMLYEMRLTVAFAFGTDDPTVYGATRYRF